MVCGRLSLTLAYPIALHMLNIWNMIDGFLIFLIISLNDSIILFWLTLAAFSTLV